MTTRQSILSRLSEAVHGTEKRFYTQGQLDEFADIYLPQFDENTPDEEIVEEFLCYWWGTEDECRRCSECGELMQAGFLISDGEAYYCSEECLHKNITEERYLEMFEDDSAFWTEWY